MYLLCAKFGRNLTCSSREDDENMGSLQTDGRLKNKWKQRLSSRIAVIRWVKDGILLTEFRAQR